MKPIAVPVRVRLAILVAALWWSVPVSAQVAPGLKDPNTMNAAELGALPGYSDALAKTTMAARPFLSIADFDKFLGAQGLSAEQRAAIYERAFVQWTG